MKSELREQYSKTILQRPGSDSRALLSQCIFGDEQYGFCQTNLNPGLVSTDHHDWRRAISCNSRVLCRLFAHLSNWLCPPNGTAVFGVNCVTWGTLHQVSCNVGHDDGRKGGLFSVPKFSHLQYARRCERLCNPLAFIPPMQPPPTPSPTRRLVQDHSGRNVETFHNSVDLVQMPIN